MMHSMRECVAMLNRALEVIVQIVDMHVAVAEAPTWRDMEITDNFVDPESALYPASFFTLRIQTLCIPFSLALLNVFASTESPRDRSICFAHLFACIAAASFLSVGRCWSAEAAAAVGGIEMSSYVIRGMPERSVST